MQPTSQISDINSPDQEATELEPVSLSRERRTSTIATKKGRAQIFWDRHISLKVPHAACRDHLANERTFLAHIRTANAFALFGITFAGLFRLNQTPSPSHAFTFYNVSVPFASTCHIISIFLTIIGTLRYLRHQKLMAQGIAIAGGWELWTIGSLVLLLSVTGFVLVMVLERKD